MDEKGNINIEFRKKSNFDDIKGMGKAPYKTDALKLKKITARGKKTMIFVASSFFTAFSIINDQWYEDNLKVARKIANQEKVVSNLIISESITNVGSLLGGKKGNNFITILKIIILYLKKKEKIMIIVFIIFFIMLALYHM